MVDIPAHSISIIPYMDQKRRCCHFPPIWGSVALDMAVPVSTPIHTESHMLPPLPTANGTISKQNPKGKSLHRHMFPVNISMRY